MRCPPSIAACLGLLLAVPVATRAQSVQGTVVTRDSIPVAGAVVALIDSVDVVGASVLSDEFGAYELRSPRRGTWRIRVERVGYMRVVSLPFELRAGESVSRTIHLRDGTTRIDALRVSDRARCDIRPDSGTLVATLWDEARKALAASMTAGGTTTLMDLDQDEIEFDATFTRARSATRATTSGRVAQSFNSAPPASLRALGYVRIIDTTTIYFGPDARALLSSEFAATHCFSLAGDDPRSIRRIGIAFTPVGRPDGLVDVAGTLWLDRESYELDRVEFRFAPAGWAEPEDTTFGGRVQFMRVPGGRVIVRHWELRMPIFAPAPERRLAPPGATSRMVVRSQPREMVSGLKVARGAARLAGELPAPLPRVEEGRRRGDDSAPACPTDSLRALGEAWLSGVARDGRGRSVRGANVRASWTRGLTTGVRTSFRTEWAEVAADPEGRYAICGIPMDRPLDVTVRVGDATRFRRRIVPSDTTARELAIAITDRDLTPPPTAAGALRGRVVDPGGRPVMNALVALFVPTRRMTTDIAGTFSFGALEPGEYDLHTRRLGHVPAIARVTVTPGDTVDIDIPLVPTAQALGTVTVESTISSMNLSGFELRRSARAGSGQFISREQVAARSMSTIISLLQAHMRLSIEQSPVTGDVKAYGRGLGIDIAGSADRCAMRLMIDGVLMPDETPLSAVPPLNDIGGIELYSSAGAIPPQFSFARAKCGLLAIWTKDGSP